MKSMRMEEILLELNNLLAANIKQNKALGLAGCRKMQLQFLQFLLHNTKMMKRT